MEEFGIFVFVVAAAFMLIFVVVCLYDICILNLYSEKNSDINNLIRYLKR